MDPHIRWPASPLQYPPVCLYINCLIINQFPLHVSSRHGYTQMIDNFVSLTRNTHLERREEVFSLALLSFLLCCMISSFWVYAVVSHEHAMSGSVCFSCFSGVQCTQPSFECFLQHDSPCWLRVLQQSIVIDNFLFTCLSS